MSGCESRVQRDQANQVTVPTIDGGDSSQLDPSSVGLVQTRTTPVMEPFGDFEFSIPEGWIRVKPDRGETKAMILLNGTVWHKADGMLKVDVGKPALPTAKATAQALSSSDGVSISVDGQDAIKVSTASTDMSKPHHAVVIYRGDKVYLVMAAGLLGTDVSNALDYVIETWNWTVQSN
jgi:hypothetical protein